MRPILLLAIGYGALYYIIEYTDTKTALWFLGIIIIGFAVGADTELREVKSALRSHAKKIFPSYFAD